MTILLLFARCAGLVFLAFPLLVAIVIGSCLCAVGNWYVAQLLRASGELQLLKASLRR